MICGYYQRHLSKCLCYDIFYPVPNDFHTSLSFRHNILIQKQSTRDLAHGSRTFPPWIPPRQVPLESPPPGHYPPYPNHHFGLGVGIVWGGGGELWGEMSRGEMSLSPGTCTHPYKTHKAIISSDNALVSVNPHGTPPQGCHSSARNSLTFDDISHFPDLKHFDRSGISLTWDNPAPPIREF